MNQEEYERFMRLRKDLFDAIAKELQIDGHHKSYEGRLYIRFPHYFEENCYADWQYDNPDYRGIWGIHLDCYVLGPTRHYEWSGRTFCEALESAENEMQQWFEQTDRIYKEEVLDIIQERKE